ncbi:MAG TPA: T9SS type A sorting domain-containing protein, partial [Rhodothermales bacterium]|nr:T9SS type A sorting domain-containing protein [Rhodothermales bacterium]
FNPATTIRYAVPQAEQVRLTVYDLLGREVAVLVDRRMAAGEHAVVFEAAGLPSGMYLYRLEAGAFSQTRRLVLIK